MDIHELKTWPDSFIEVFMEKKTFELRKNDRDFKIGDMVILKEYDPETGYTGKSLSRKIIYILKNFEGLDKDFVILQLA
jgi:hypothetical protein